MKSIIIGNNGETIPQLGLGTWKSGRGETGRAVLSAIEIGYRHIDCAPIYQNEREVGEALNEAIQSGRVRRHDLFITSKLWNNAHGAKHVRPALERSLKDLQLDYLDLFLIHWPVHFQPNVTFPRKPEDFIPLSDLPIEETWQAMEKLANKGLCRHIGVCNFNIHLLDQLTKSVIPPAMNQIELHPYLQQREMLHYCREHHILLTAYAPLGSGDRPAAMKKDDEPSLLNHPLISRIATKHKATAAQVLLSWALQRGTLVIPKSVSAERQRENYLAFELSLDASDVSDIDGIDHHYRFVDGAFFTSAGSPYSVKQIWGE